MSIFGYILDYIRGILNPDMTSDQLAAALDDRAEGREALDWRDSIVDLLKLLDLDSSRRARKALYAELGFEDKYRGSAEQNITLHREVMARLAREGIPVP
jgi:hypothetical protein